MRQQFIPILRDESKITGNAVVPLRRMKSAHMFLFASWEDERNVVCFRKSEISEVLPKLALQMVFYRVNMNYRIGLHLTNRPITRLRR